MKVELTEQQARAVAAAARYGLKRAREEERLDEEIGTPSDVGSAYVAAERLDEAWKESVNG